MTLASPTSAVSGEELHGTTPRSIGVPPRTEVTWPVERDPVAGAVVAPSDAVVKTTTERLMSFSQSLRGLVLIIVARVNHSVLIILSIGTRIPSTRLSSPIMATTSRVRESHRHKRQYPGQRSERRVQCSAHESVLWSELLETNSIPSSFRASIRRALHDGDQIQL